MPNEIYYCGKCERQQQESEGHLCKVCKKPTVTWSSNESATDVKNKWKRLYGN